MITLNNFKQEMIKKAKAKGGIWENFGQKELSKLKDKYYYNDLVYKHNAKSRILVRKVYELNEWAKNYSLNN